MRTGHSRNYAENKACKHIILNEAVTANAFRDRISASSSCCENLPLLLGLYEFLEGHPWLKRCLNCSTKRDFPVPLGPTKKFRKPHSFFSKLARPISKATTRIQLVSLSSFSQNFANPSTLPHRFRIEGVYRGVEQMPHQSSEAERSLCHKAVIDAVGPPLRCVRFRA